MTPQELKKTFNQIGDALLTCRRENIRTLARTKALEAMVRNSIPENKRAEWHKMLNRQTKVILHGLLVSIENQNASAAASLDDRDEWEVNDE